MSLNLVPRLSRAKKIATRILGIRFCFCLNFCFVFCFSHCFCCSLDLIHDSHAIYDRNSFVHFSPIHFPSTFFHYHLLTFPLSVTPSCLSSCALGPLTSTETPPRISLPRFTGCCHSKPNLVAGGRVFVWPYIQRIDR